MTETILPVIVGGLVDVFSNLTEGAIMFDWNRSDCVVYTACRMTGRDQHEMVQRAKYVVGVLAQYGIKGISPVIEESVKDINVKLINHDKDRLKMFWRRDKFIIRRIAHVVLIDGAEDKSFGIEREYMLSRGVLWKPTVSVLSRSVASSVIEFEDDAVFSSIHAAAAFIAQNWMTRRMRWKWRLKMLNRSLLKWLIDQAWAWR